MKSKQPQNGEVRKLSKTELKKVSGGAFWSCTKGSGRSFRHMTVKLEDYPDVNDANASRGGGYNCIMTQAE